MSHKVVLMLTAALLLAGIGIGLALLSARHTEEDLEDLAAANLEQARVIYELEIALLEQGGLAAYYMLDGSTQWVDRIRQREPFFDQWLERVKEVGLEQDQQEYIQRISEAFRDYETERDRAIAAYETGDLKAARELLFGRTYPAYDKTYRLCEELSQANDHDIEAAVSAQRKQAKAVRRWGVTSLILAGLFMLGLIWLLAVRVLRPMRRMARDLNAIDGPDSPSLSGDELQTISNGMERLRNGVAEAHLRLERSNRHLLDAEQLASVGRLAAGVAHEIRSPLTALRLRLFSIQKALAGAPERRADLQVMSEEIGRLEGMVSSFLEFSRPPSLNLQHCSVSLILDKTLELLRHRLDVTRIQVQRDEPRHPPSLLADAQQLKQVFLNLLSNAIDALPAKGTIRISVREEQGKPDCPCLAVQFRDNGPGIPPEAVPRIFDPFYSTKDTGAGLGLWVAYRIVAEHNGTLELERSVPGETMFAVRLPVPGPVLAGEGYHEQDSCRR